MKTLNFSRSFLVLFLFASGCMFSQTSPLKTKNVSSSQYKTLKQQGQISGDYEYVIDGGVLLPVNMGNGARPAGPPSPPPVLTPCDPLPVQGPNAYTTQVDDSPLATVPLQFTFCFYGTNYTSLRLSPNGNVQFSTNSTAFSSTGFPSTVVNMIAPFWADGESMVTSGGRTYGKIYIDSNPHYMIISWDSLGYFNDHVDKLNSFQLVLTDGTDPILPAGKNVGFYYKKMQWTTGDASGGTNGFPTTQPGTPATIGANQGNGNDYFLIGRFGVPGSIYDGPLGNSDGVSWLDGKRFFFDVCPPVGTNQAPVSTLIGDCDTMKVCGNDTLIIKNTFIGPEVSQTVTITATAPTLGSSFSYTTMAAGNSTDISMYVDGNTAAPGNHMVTVSATDNGTPPLTTTQSFIVYVDPAAPNPINGHIIFTPNIGICPGGSTTASIVVTGGVPDSYLWKNNASTTSTSFTITPALDSTVYVTIKAGFCRKTITNYIRVNPVPVASILGTAALCSTNGTTTVLTATNTLNSAYQAPYTYAWTGSPAPLPANTQSTTVSAGSYSVTITNRFNCRASATFTVTTATAPVFTVVPSNTLVCLPLGGSAAVPLAVSLNSPPPATSCGLSSSSCSSPVNVDIGNGTVQNSNTGYPCVLGNYHDNNRHQILYTAADLNAAGITSGRLSSIAFEIISMNPRAVPSNNSSFYTSVPFNYTIKIKCTTANVLNTTFDNTGLVQVFSGSYLGVVGWNTFNFTQPYEWPAGSNILIDICYDLQTNYSSNPVMRSTNVGSAKCIYRGLDGVAMCGTTQAAITTNNRPNIRLGMCTTASLSDYSYTWSQAAGLSSTSVSNPTATVTSPVVYTVAVAPLSSPSCSSAATTTIQVYNPVTPTISPVSPMCTSATAVTMTATPTGGTWTGSGVNPTTGLLMPANATPGVNTYTYTYGVSSCTSVATTTVSVEQFIPSTITSALSPQCVTNAALPLPTTASPTGTWTGTGVSGANFDPATAGVGTHTLTYSTNSSPTPSLCPSSSSVTVDVSTIVQPTISAAGPYCDNFTVRTMTVSPSGGTWGSQTAGTSITANGDLSPSSSVVGSHIISYTLVSGPCTAVATETVEITHYVDPSIANAGPFCIYEPVLDLQTLATNQGGVWSGPGVSGTDFTPSVAGVGSHVLTYSTNPVPFYPDLCSESSQITIQINDRSKITPQAFEYAGCNYPFIAQFSILEQNSAGTLSWNYGDKSDVETGSEFGPYHTYTTPGIYTVTTTYTNNVGCVTTSTMSTAITVYAVPDSDFSPSPDVTTVVDGEVTFTNQTSNLNDNTYEWYFAGLGGSSEVSPVFLFTNSGEYFVRLVAFSPEGCSDTTLKKITVNPDVVLYVPNAFTPNGDGLNDEFQIFLPPTGVDYSTFSLTVYDRWGEAIYKSSDITKFWNGAKNNSGEIVKQDTYVYKITFKDENKKFYEKVGYVVLLSGK